MSVYSCELAQEVYKVSQQKPCSSPGINHCNPTEDKKLKLLFSLPYILTTATLGQTKDPSDAIHLRQWPIMVAWRKKQKKQDTSKVICPWLDPPSFRNSVA